MNLISQKSAIEDMQNCVNSDRRSVLLVGPQGCGKTYLAHEFARMLNIHDFQMVKSTVDEIRTVIDECYQNSNRIVICIENLDEGVAAASATMLKFLEEPLPQVYIVVTCRNINRIPDTIISRSFSITVAPPVDSDLDQYAQNKDFAKYSSLSGRRIWQSVHTFYGVDAIYGLSTEDIGYIESLYDLLKSRKSIHSIMNGFRYFPNGKQTPIDLVMPYIASQGDARIRRHAYSCIKDLDLGRLGGSAVLTKFLFEVKYGA